MCSVNKKARFRVVIMYCVDINIKTSYYPELNFVFLCRTKKFNYGKVIIRDCLRTD